MKNVFWIIPGILCGRAGPDMETWSLDEIRDSGIKAVLNVSEHEPNQSNFESANIDLEWIPFPASYPATEETEQVCLELLPKAYQFLRSNINERKCVLVHCSWGRDRSGLLLAYHLAISKNLGPREAIAELRKIRPKAITALGWEDMAERVIGKLTSGKTANKLGHAKTTRPDL
jgi:protein-tyrosine phosphatase